MDIPTLYAANLVVLFIFASCFAALARRIANAPYWRSWATANLLLAAALIAYSLEARLPLSSIYILPNFLLMLGFAYHVHAARQICGSSYDGSVFWGPLAALAVATLPAMVLGDYRLVYLGTNMLVTGLAVNAMWTYLHAGRQGLISAYGMLGAFSLMAIEGLIRTVHGLVLDPSADAGLRSNIVLTTHLFTSLVFSALTGACALCLSFEQKAHDYRDASRRDPLTGIFNRREFERQLARLVAAQDYPFAVVQFDIDHFKSVNDRYGHVIGDRILEEFAELIETHLRDHDCFARLGGEEFAVLMPNVSEANAIKIAERLRSLVSGHIFDFADEDLRITVSAGVFHGTGANRTPDGIMKAVDECLYRSKNAGRNRVSVSRPHTSAEEAAA
ncbi:diguanylate cyclase (GGDEF)-like protein [Roseibium hamelinense]|uniref:diguanylate cyclase n=1 Tax=Roseibium hamelinense TaxID=150831 RepID=A0A562T9G4_9HYPH|nr:GGDEF domain-containing protein [Roseibium hamelinense]TWI90259.1 diguanylate cyclase (GGDEF)-like protein [Roseibium hamelinense]